MSSSKDDERTLYELVFRAAKAVGNIPIKEKNPSKFDSVRVKQVREFLRQELISTELEDLPTGEALEAVNALLQWEVTRKEIVDARVLPRVAKDPRFAIWRGDITTLRIGAIVNAANERGLGCFQPMHRCVDNVIHCAAGPGLREACAEGLKAPKYDGKLRTSSAMVTAGFNLPADHVIHTTGPVGEKPEELAGCYRSVLDCCKAKRIRSVAFCCISTGLFGYPADRAADVAIKTVQGWLDEQDAAVGVVPETSAGGAGDAPPPPPVPLCPLDLVVFNVFLESDLDIYKELLGTEEIAVEP
jgi:O-acetyl-ADP-ribose deacetylase (regulator of RNase III)